MTLLGRRAGTACWLAGVVTRPLGELSPTHANCRKPALERLARHSLFGRYMKAQLRLAGDRRKLGRNGLSSDRPRECVDPPEYLRDLRRRGMSCMTSAADATPHAWPRAGRADFREGQHTLGVCRNWIRFSRVFDGRQRAVAAPSCNDRRVSDVLAVRGRACDSWGVRG